MNPMAKVYRKNQNVLSRNIAGEKLLIPIRGKLADMQALFALDPVAEFIWLRLDGGQPLADIRDAIVSRYQVRAAQAEADLVDFTRALLEARLITEVSAHA
jgi:hypothetical protein